MTIDKLAPATSRGKVQWVLIYPVDLNIAVVVGANLIIRFFVEVIVNVPAVVRLSATNHHRFAAAACSPRRPQRSGVVAVRISPHGESPDVKMLSSTQQDFCRHEQRVATKGAAALELNVFRNARRIKTFGSHLILHCHTRHVHPEHPYEFPQLHTHEKRRRGGEVWCVAAWAIY